MSANDATAALIVNEVRKLLAAAMGPPSLVVDPDAVVRLGVPRDVAEEISDASAGVVDDEDVTSVLDRFRSRLTGDGMDPMKLAESVPRI
jgi:hypothetical protein